MQFINDYFTGSADGVAISAAQGSAFAKQVAGDFNPIHDPESKRFCVPGDLLFAIALNQYGLHQSMSFEFLDMVKADSKLIYPSALSGSKVRVGYASQLTGVDGKDALAIETAGEVIDDCVAIEKVLRKYVSFSGQNFPYILVPLMEQHNVMINPTRPLVIYQSMSFEFTSLEFSDLDIKLASTALDVQGKRGDATFQFAFYDGESEVGHGTKKLVLSGLRPFEAQVMQTLCDDYLANAKSSTK